MKKTAVVAVVLLLSFSLFSCSKIGKPGEKKSLKTNAEKVSYALGLEIGTSLKEMKTDIDLDAFMQGIKDTLKGGKTLLTQQQALDIKREFFTNLQNENSKNNKKNGEVFLAENKKKSGVITTASGLQYIVLKQVAGPKPLATDKVTVNYVGTLIDGTEFDNSYKRGQPATFPVNQVIPGWTEAIQLMSVGSKFRFFIPSALAYGERGAGQRIGPNSALIFEVELLGINK